MVTSCLCIEMASAEDQSKQGVRRVQKRLFYGLEGHSAKKAG